MEKTPACSMPILLQCVALRIHPSECCAFFALCDVHVIRQLLTIHGTKVYAVPLYTLHTVSLHYTQHTFKRTNLNRTSIGCRFGLLNNHDGGTRTFEFLYSRITASLLLNHYGVRPDQEL